MLKLKTQKLNPPTSPNRFLLLQKRPRAFNQLNAIPKVHNRQLVGGNLEATTYRPPSIFSHNAQQPQSLHRRNDLPHNNHQQLQQTQFIQTLPQQQQQQYLHQQLLLHQQQQQQLHLQNLQQQQYIQQQPIYTLQSKSVPNIPQQQSYLLQQQQPLINQQIAQKRLDQINNYNNPQQIQPVPYRPFANIPTHDQQQQQQSPQQQQHILQDQLVYNQLLQERRSYEEQQLRQQFNRPHNRFIIANPNYNNNNNN